MKINNLLKLVVTMFLSVNIFSQTVTKVLVSGLTGYTSHDTDVLNSFLLGYSSYDGTKYPSQIDLHIDNSAYSAIQYANQNNYQIVIRSYTGLNSAVNDTAKNYPNVLLFMPAGSNSFYYVCTLDIPNAAAVSTGAGIDTLVTGYKVEFFSIDPITNSNSSSFSNGYIAGQIAYLANRYNISLQQARSIARNNSYVNNQSTNYVQYGEINLSQAVNSTDSYLQALPVELNEFSAFKINNQIKLNWSTSNEVNNYGFDVERFEKNNKKYSEWKKIGFIKGAGNSNLQKFYSFIDNTVSQGDFLYRLKQIDNNGNYKYSKKIEINFANQEAISLHQNYPNPFNPTTTIKYEVVNSERIIVNVYNWIGQLVENLFDGIEEPGSYELIFDGSKLASGIYFVKMESASEIKTLKMALLK